MAKKYKTVLFIFRRDLRLVDNTALIHAHRDAQSVIPAFIFDPRQLEKHRYRSLPAMEFMLNSLEELDESLKQQGGSLYFAKNEAEAAVKELIEKHHIDALYINGDYTPFSKKRDKALEKLCSENSVGFHCFHDALLNAPGKVLKDDGEPYTVYTPFFKKASKIEVPKPRNTKDPSWKKIKSNVSPKDIRDEYIDTPLEEPFRRGGRNEALAILRELKQYKNYQESRNIPSKRGTTGLSPHHKFGTVSAREVYEAVEETLGSEHGLIGELYWRDFFTHIGFHFPHVYKEAFRTKYSSLKWSQSKKNFEAWCEGRTGYPIVDAGMRELNATGYMHNRVRMIVASFLVKDLLLNWQWGEAYFAEKLLDYDPAVNNGNWQWAASTGCDAQPYFRIFNPWSQLEKFDKECQYVKKWIPELEDLTPKDIANLQKPKNNRPESYPAPIVNHSEARESALDLFKSAT